MYNIEIYHDKNNKSELKEYINNLQKNKNKDNNIKFNKIISYIRMLRIYGLSLGEPFIKRIDSELWELRPIRDRIFFSYYDKNKFILLNIFTKKTNKTPKSEILKAKKILNDYRKRCI